MDSGFTKDTVLKEVVEHWYDGMCPFSCVETFIDKLAVLNYIGEFEGELFNLSLSFIQDGTGLHEIINFSDANSMSIVTTWFSKSMKDNDLLEHSTTESWCIHALLSSHWIFCCPKV